MKPGWEIKTIGEVCEIYNGGTPSTSIPEYWDGGIQWITPKDMGKTKEMYVSHCERTISQEGVEHSSTKVLPERSVIVSSRAPIGYVAINDVPMATNQGCKGFVLGKELYPEFLYYFLLASKELLNKLGTGATFKEVSGKKLAGIEVPVPSLPEQQRIVDILDREFAGIDALKANAEKSLQAAKDLFQATLKKELEPKEGWKTSTLSSIGKTATGTTPSTTHKEYYGDFIPFIKPADINIDGKGGLCYNNEGLSEEGANNGRVFQENSILMVCIGASIGKVGFALCPVSCNQQINILTPSKEYHWKFLYYCMASPVFQHKVIKEGESAKATLPIINKSKWERLTITAPDIKEQEKIITRLDDINDRCKSLQDNYHKTLTLCDNLKQSLLRKAFNGEL